MHNKANQDPWFLTVINSLIEGMIIINQKGLIAHLNPAAERITEWKREEAFGKSLTDILQLFNDSVEFGHESSFDERYPGQAHLITKSGKKIAVDSSTSFIRDESHEITGYIVLIRDVTERQQIEAALKNSRKRYKALVNAIEGIVWESEWESHKYLFVSRYAEPLLGYPAEAWTSDVSFWKKLVHPEDQEMVNGTFKELQPGGKFELEYRLIRMDGKSIWIRDIGHLVAEQDQVRKLQGVMVDITERKRIEQMLRKAHQELETRVQIRTVELREAETKYRTLVEKIPGIVYIAKFGIGVSWLYVSPQIQPILGFSVKEWLADPQFWFKQIHPDDRARVLAEEARSQVTAQPFVSEYRMFRSDGRLVWIHDEASVIRNEAGEPVLLQGVMLEITEHKKAQEELRYRAAFDELTRSISSEFINLSSSEVDGAINRALESIGKFARADRSYIALFSENGTRMYNTHEWCAAGIESQMHRFQNVPVQTFPWAMEKLRRFETVSIGSIKDLPVEALAEKQEFERAGIRSAISVPMIYRESLIGFVGFVKNHEEIDWSGKTIVLLKMVGEIFVNALIRKQSEKALRESEERYRVLYDDNPAMYFTLDTRGIVLSVNWFGAQQLGYAVEDLVGKSILMILDEEDRQPFLDDLESVLKNENKLGGEEFRMIRKDQTLLWVKQLMRVVPDASGVPTVFVVCEDISEQKFIREAMDQLQEQLRQSQKMEAIGQLAGGVAHDFNNILMAMSGYCELLHLKLPVNSSEAHDVAEILKSVNQASALTRQLLALGRRQVLQPKVLELNSVLTDLEGMLRRLIREDITMIMQLDSTLGQVQADPGQIEQVIVNLAVNARDAMPKGGKLTFETRNVTLDESYTGQNPTVTPGEYVLLSVSDTGCGMTEEIKSRIFEPFFTTKEPGKGTGLGLSTAYGIIKQSGGNITAYSEPERGSTFKIYLPRIQQQQQQPSSSDAITASTAQESPATETILLVDDNDSVRSAVTAALEIVGYTVLQATNGQEGLEISRKYPGPIHVVMTDMVMPEMGGLELVELLQQERPDAKILFISGYADEAVKREGKLGAGMAFLSKPATIQAIHGKIRELLSSTNL